MVQVVKQISVFLDNKPGVLASMASAISSAGINLLAISVVDTIDHAVERMVVSDPGLARDMFEEAGMLTIISEVLAVELSDRPGEIAKLAHTLSEAKVNIEYLYGSVPRGGSRALIYVRVSNTDKALRALGGRRDRPAAKTARKKAGKKKAAARKKARATKKSGKKRTAKKKAAKKTSPSSAGRKARKKTAKKKTARKKSGRR